MRTLFVGNFDFEWQFIRHAPSPLPARLQRLNRELATAWISIANDGDAIWCPGKIDDSFFDSLNGCGLPNVRQAGDWSDVSQIERLCPWGWSEALRDRRKCVLTNEAVPAQGCLRTVNSRRFSFELEQQWKTSLPGSCCVDSLDELAGAVHNIARSNSTGDWILKAEFGMSGREQRRGSGPQLDSADVAWAERRLNGSPLFVEPRCQLLQEIGIQFHIPSPGASSSDRNEPVCLGVTELLTDTNGQYAGSRLHADNNVDARWQPAIETAERAAVQAQAAGYFGPLGIDAASYQSGDGTRLFRPLQDVNARYTMGRLALGWRRFLQPSDLATWRRVNWSDGQSPQMWYEHFQQRLPDGMRMIRTTPFEVNNLPTTHGMLLLISDNKIHLKDAEKLAAGG